VSESPDLVAAVFEADAAERQRLLSEAEPGRLAAAIQRLGQLREPAAAEVLALIDSVIADRGLRKAARRELHRLRSIGVQAPQIAQPRVQEPVAAQRGEHVEFSEAWATYNDLSGPRAVGLLADRRL